MDLATANALTLSLGSKLVGLTLVSLGRGRFALEGATAQGAAVWIERLRDARPFLAA